MTRLSSARGQDGVRVHFPELTLALTHGDRCTCHVLLCFCVATSRPVPILQLGLLQDIKVAKGYLKASGLFHSNTLLRIWSSQTPDFRLQPADS